MPWLDPSLSLRWGPYTKPDGAEEQAIVTATLAAHEGNLITTRMAVEKIAGIYGIENVDAALAAIEEEKATNQAKALEIATAQSVAEQNNLHKLSGHEDPKGNRGRGKRNTAGASSGGSGGDPAAVPSEE